MDEAIALLTYGVDVDTTCTEVAIISVVLCCYYIHQEFQFSGGNSSTDSSRCRALRDGGVAA